MAAQEKLEKAVLTKDGEVLTILYSEKRGLCQKTIRVNGRVAARETVRGSIRTHRNAIRVMVKWGWTLVSDTTADDKDTASDEKFAATLEILQDRALEIEPPQNVPSGKAADWITVAFTTLARREPSRLKKLYASLDAGRTDDVVYALYRYLEGFAA